MQGVAAVYNVAQSQVTCSAVQDSGRLLSGVRRLQAVTFTVTYTISATPDQAAAAETSPPTEAALTAALPTFAVVTGSFGEREPTIDVAPGGQRSTGNVVAAEASSSTTVLVLGAVGLVVLFLAVLVPTLCRRRLAALLGLKRNNANASSKTPMAHEEPEGSNRSHDWDVDKSTNDAHMAESGSAHQEASSTASGDSSAKISGSQLGSHEQRVETL